MYFLSKFVNNFYSKLVPSPFSPRPPHQFASRKSVKQKKERKTLASNMLKPLQVKTTTEDLKWYKTKKNSRQEKLLIHLKT